ncbi:MAG: hypothetical protein KDD62_14585, partial [Bdellovibrionales bacterium]|nr:hypothetical protein [Bdellovibrionales bacterium]
MASIANVSMGMNWADLLKRRSTLKQAFKVSKLLILASCLILLLLTVLLLINNFLEIGTSVSKLQNAVQNAVLRVEADSDDNQEKPNYRLIITRNKPFGDLKVKQVEEEPAPVEKPVSNVPLNLIGTFMTTGEAPYAIIEDKKK